MVCVCVRQRGWHVTGSHVHLLIKSLSLTHNEAYFTKVGNPFTIHKLADSTNTCSQTSCVCVIPGYHYPFSLGKYISWLHLFTQLPNLLTLKSHGFLPNSCYLPKIYFLIQI